jgi:hypothetical protein
MSSSNVGKVHVKPSALRLEQTVLAVYQLSILPPSIAIHFRPSIPLTPEPLSQADKIRLNATAIINLLCTDRHSIMDHKFSKVAHYPEKGSGSV